VQSAQNALELDNVPYGLNGSFAVNLWMRRLPNSNTSGVTFGYLFSHTGVAAASGASPNEVGTLAAPVGGNSAAASTSSLAALLTARCKALVHCPAAPAL
jgi:hypothetical protein